MPITARVIRLTGTCHADLQVGDTFLLWQQAMQARSAGGFGRALEKMKALKIIESIGLKPSLRS